MSLSAGSHSHSARLAQAKTQTSRQLLFYLSLSLSLSLLANNTALEEAIIHLMFPAIFTQGRQSLSWVALSFALYYSLSLSSSPKVLRCEKKRWWWAILWGWFTCIENMAGERWAKMVALGFCDDDEHLLLLLLWLVGGNKNATRERVKFLFE